MSKSGGTPATQSHTDTKHSDGPNSKVGHVHAEADVTSLTADLAAKIAKSLYGGKGSLLGATAAGTPADVPATTDGYSLVLDSSLGVGFGWKPRSRVNDEQHADVSDTGTGKTAIATLAIPTTVAQGDRIDVVCGGDTLQNAGGTTLPEFKIGATAINQAGTALVALAIGNSATRRSWKFVGSIYVLGASSQFVDGILTIGIASGVGSTGNQFQLSGAAAEDLSAGKNAVLSFTLSAGGATQDIVCHAASLSVTKKG